MGELFGLERADGLDGGELRERIEFFEFAQSLRGKSDLEHKWRGKRRGERKARLPGALGLWVTEVQRNVPDARTYENQNKT